MVSYYNRDKKIYETEAIVGESSLTWLYNTTIGMGLLEAIVKKKFFSSIYGKYLDSKFSKNKIAPFIRDYSINEDEFLEEVNSFKSFNEFFYRKVKISSRNINMNDNILVSPGDGKILAFKNININQIIQVKGYTYSLEELIGNHNFAENYQGGSILVLRLCPTDYHRFHFIDSGTCDSPNKINGFYYSVSPIALSKVKKIFCQNKRQYCVFHSDNFKDILYVEVGATCVGSIIDTFKPGEKYERGSEKGYFKFGGSTVILFFQKDTITIDEEILSHSSLGFETLVKLGYAIGAKQINI